MEIREHHGYAHGLRPGETQDMNCPNCKKEVSEMTRPLDALDQMMAYEQGELDDLETTALFQYLVDSGTINHLQGSYQREAQYMILQGLVTPASE